MAERWYIAKDIINSGMVNVAVLNGNWDGDLRDGNPLRNIDEIIAGTNPLNRLEVDPNDPSERYAVLVFSCASQEDWRQLPMAKIDVENAGTIYKMFLKNGYSADNILLIVDPGPELAENNVTTGMAIDFKVEYRNGQVVSDSRAKMADYFLKQTANLPSDENDMIIIHESAHGNSSAIRLGRIMDFAEFNEALQMKFGQLISIFASCSSEGYIDSLNKLNANPNMLLMAVSSGDELGTQEIGLSVFGKMALGYSVEFCSTSFVLSGSSERFMNPLIFTKSNP